MMMINHQAARLAFLALLFATALSTLPVAQAAAEEQNLRGDDFERDIRGNGRGRACGRRLTFDNCFDKFDDDCVWCVLPGDEGRKGRLYGGKCITDGEPIDECLEVIDETKRGRELKKGRACGRQLNLSDCQAKFDDGCGWCTLTPDQGRKGRDFGGKCITMGEDSTDECGAVLP